MRKKPEKPLHKQAAEFVIHHLADKSAFAPFTGTDYDAWHAYLPLIRLWGRTRSNDVVVALRAVVHCAQTRNDDVMAVFKKAIPCLLDWSDERNLWHQIAPSREIVSVSYGQFSTQRLTEHPRSVSWPCSDGPRICHHDNSKPCKPDEQGWPGYLSCTDCGAIWRQNITATK